MADIPNSLNGLEIDHNSWQNKTKEEIQEVLRKGICIVSFIKSDGTERKLRGSLSPDILPDSAIIDHGEANKILRTDSVSVWEVDKNWWRSFNIGRLISIEEGEN